VSAAIASGKDDVYETAIARRARGQGGYGRGAGADSDAANVATSLEADEDRDHEGRDGQEHAAPGDDLPTVVLAHGDTDADCL
jgi:hypothetical protein